ncbi:DUF6928 family protein [Streptomyces sp. NPDC101171]|uniref:DUF6928 family protein n=1 Tax=Streptomyces sp. NPDC101171 TaxID=3366122 RepID=UPI0037FB09C8
MRPSELPEHLVAASAGRRLVLHAMHSVVDWLAFAVWEDGRLVRSLSLSPDSGVILHPLDLGEDALRALCGFVREGRPEPDDIDTDGIRLYGYRVRVREPREGWG